ncbi:DUF6191 domain-containing protein [Nonomuraea sediminis]|uniref:DUF6191 domain-containing protein n=1 Tax=Nonomuraea sediminis TaxID=2835864 RepID=UPI001BDCBBD1|nr:DUF6191 domain-containing protein [Nonomuraea sediminis]
MELVACLLIFVVLLERLWKWAAGVKRSGRAVTAPGVEELAAAFQGSKRIELEQRETELMLRDDETDGAPPTTRIDLTSGRAVIQVKRK